MNIIELTLDGVPLTLNVTQRKLRNHHARHRYYKMWYQQVILAARGKVPVEPWGKVLLTFILYVPRYRDFDSAVSSLKPICDGLRLAGLIKDDTYKVTGPWIVTEEITPKAEPDGSVRIVIENLSV